MPEYNHHTGDISSEQHRYARVRAVQSDELCDQSSQEKTCDTLACIAEEGQESVVLPIYANHIGRTGVPASVQPHVIAEFQAADDQCGLNVTEHVSDDCDGKNREYVPITDHMRMLLLSRSVPEQDPDRRAGKTEGFPEIVLEITLVRKMHECGIIDKNHESRGLR